MSLFLSALLWALKREGKEEEEERGKRSKKRDLSFPHILFFFFFSCAEESEGRGGARLFHALFTCDVRKKLVHMLEVEIACDSDCLAYSDFRKVCVE